MFSLRRRVHMKVLPSLQGSTRQKEKVMVATIFSDLKSFEKNLPKSKVKRKTEDTIETNSPKAVGKRKADDTAEASTPKKPRNIKAKPVKSVDVDAMKRLPKKEEEKLMKIDFNKFMSMYPFGTNAIFPISVEKIMEALSIYFLSEYQ
ncbi:hypothetical protein R1sor_024206 [Riccia sorocarpa]|uniref:Uncharacterized protein n=1 Tax=Riccia sorocarpa TaxID=122646 RepID=A0ABD3GT26_9MARC